jgi:hypothetical protein
MDQPITASEFKKRLAQLCLSGQSNDLPRKQRDRQIILKSITLRLSKEKSYSERELNAALMRWVGEVGHCLTVDHAALRRALVDEKHLDRTEGGASYCLSDQGGVNWFDPDVDELTPAQVIDEAILEAAAKRDKYRNQSSVK